MASWPSLFRLYLNRDRSPAPRFRLEYPISRARLPGGIITLDAPSLARLRFWIRPPTETDSITTGGSNEFVLSDEGFTNTNPFVVGNQRTPSFVLHAAGWDPSVHSRVGKPSASTKIRQF